jgi:hypothetical protein
MLKISADYTDYADYVRSSCTSREDQNARTASTGFFGPRHYAALNRNLRNLCNLRIFKFLSYNLWIG